MERNCYQENTSCHTSMNKMSNIQKLQLHLFSHSPYLPDVASSDFYLFKNNARLERKLDLMNMWSPKQRSILLSQINRSTRKIWKCWSNVTLRLIAGFGTHQTCRHKPWKNMIKYILPRNFFKTIIHFILKTAFKLVNPFRHWTERNEDHGNK